MPGLRPRTAERAADLACTDHGDAHQLLLPGRRCAARYRRLVWTSAPPETSSVRSIGPCWRRRDRMASRRCLRGWSLSVESALLWAAIAARMREAHPPARPTHRSALSTYP